MSWKPVRLSREDRLFSYNKCHWTALKGHKSQVSKVIFLKNQGYIATSSWDGTVKIWYIDKNHCNE